MPLTAGSKLVVSEQVAIVRVNGVFHLSLGQLRVPCERSTLSVLDSFSRPTDLRSGIADLEPRLKGASAFVELVAHVKALHEVGVLVEAGVEQTSGPSSDKRFDSAPVHIRMLNDTARTSSFQAAIRSTVTPEDVVLDIGTGTGVLAVTAALAGARHVYAVEATGVARVARRLAAANGVADRVTIIDGHSFDIDLPERATVLVSEIIGDDPLSEKILPCFADARQRLLVEGASVLPSALRVLALPVEVPADRMEGSRFTSRRAALWTDRYGLDFSVLAETAEEQAQRVHLNSYEVRTWKRLAEPLLLVDLDLQQAGPQPIEHDVELRITASGSLSAFLVFFEADLGPTVSLSLHPDAATPENSWGNLLYVLPAPVDVVAGREVDLRYRHDQRGSRFNLGFSRRDEQART